MGGGGGDGGASARQAQIEAQKAEARKRLNILFGSGATAIDPNNYYKRSSAYDMVTNNSPFGDYVTEVDDNGNEAPKVFDQAAYDADLASADEAVKNRTARENLYSGIRDNAFNSGKRGLDENREKAQRNTKFALFAQGLNGGSEDIDQNALLDRTYNQGLLDLGAKADAAETDFRTNDEKTRLGLLQSIDAGMDQSSAISSAINQLANNSAQATASANTSALDDVFANSGALYTTSQAAKGKQAAADWWNNFAGSGGGSSGRSGISGTVTPAN